MPSPAEHEWEAAAPREDHLGEPTLHAYLDGELSEAEQQAAAAHLAGCADCSARAASLQTLFSSIEALPDISLARDMAPAVVATLRHDAQNHPAIDRRRLWWLAPQAIAAALMLAFALPALSATWPTEAVTLHGASEILREFGIDELAGETARTMDGLADGIAQFADAAWKGLARLDGVTSTALAPYSGWSTPAWAGLLLALLPLWWLANRWLLRVDLPQPTAARERRPA